MMNLRFVEDLAGLQTLKVHHQNQLALVKSTGDTYWFDAASATDEDGFLFVKPTDTAVNFAGRWRLVE